jgi:hypothetical protein
MKKLKQSRMRKIALIAFGIIAIIATICILTAPTKGGVVVSSAMALVVGGITLEGKDEAIYNAMIEAVKAEVGKFDKGYISETKAKENIDEAISKAKFDLTKDENYIKLLDDFNAIGVKMKGFEETGKPENLTFSKEFETVFEKNKDAIMEASKGGRTVKFQLKTAATIISAGNMAAGVNFGFRESQVDGTLSNELDLISLVSVMNGGPGSNPLSWVERSVLNGGATGVAEGGTKPLMDVQWIEAEANARTIAVMAAISKRAANNRATLEQEVREELLISLRNELSRQLYEGADTTAEIKGIQSVYAAAFAATDVVTTPTYWDALLAAWKQSRKAYKGSRPTAILVSIGTGVNMDWQKSTATGMYFFPAFMTNQNKSLKGIPIVESDDVTDGDFLVGDFSKYLFNYTQPVTIELGYINDDFAINQFRLRAELEGMGRVKAQYKNGFVKGTFSTAITDLTS